MTSVRWSQGVVRQFSEVSADVRRAIIHTIQLVEEGELLYPYRDHHGLWYKPVVGHPNWYLVLREHDTSFVFVRIRHAIREA